MEMFQDVRLEDLSKYKEMIKRGGERSVSVPTTHEEDLKEKNERGIIHRVYSV